MNTSETLMEVEKVLVPYLVDIGWKLLGAAFSGSSAAG